VTVVGQKQGQPGYTADQINVLATKKDPSFPFYKPYLIKDEYGGDSPQLQARMALEKMQHVGHGLVYTVEGHSQGGKNWGFNELATVYDDQYKGMVVDGKRLIYGRTFEKVKGEAGTTTKLLLGLPGKIA
jgi:prophage tail gpP-like protein